MIVPASFWLARCLSTNGSALFNGRSTQAADVLRRTFFVATMPPSSAEDPTTVGTRPLQDRLGHDADALETNKAPMNPQLC